MKLNTFKKYFITVSVIFLLCLTFTVAILSFLINDYLADDKFQSLGTTCNSLAKFTVVDHNSSSYRRNIYNIASAISKTEGTLIVITDRIGNIQACTCDDYAISGECVHTSSPVENLILNETDKADFNRVGTLGGVFDSMHYISGKALTSFDGTVLGYVYAASPASDFSEFYADLFKLYTFSAIVPIVIMFFALYKLTYKWTKPLKLMAEASKAMAKGDFSRRIPPVKGDDEISALAKSFNQMTNSLAEMENMRRGFIANVSHELKTPMTTIGGFIDGIIDGTIESDKQQYYLKIVSDEVRRLSRLVQGMLSLSKLEAGETPVNPTLIDLKELLIGIVIGQEQRIEKNNLEICGLDEIYECKIYADKDLLHQVIYNLCDNAIKFTEKGGTILFALKTENEQAVFKIRNTGNGIPAQDLPLVFDRFYKGDKSRSVVKDSTGLGLYLVKTIVKIHGGKVSVSSKQGEFTEFSVSLPIDKFNPNNTEDNYGKQRK